MWKVRVSLGRVTNGNGRKHRVMGQGNRRPPGGIRSLEYKISPHVGSPTSLRAQRESPRYVSEAFQGERAVRV